MSQIPGSPRKPSSSAVPFIIAILLAVSIKPLIALGFILADRLATMPWVSIGAAYLLLFALVWGVWNGLAIRHRKFRTRKAMICYVAFSFGMAGVYFLADRTGHECFRFAAGDDYNPSILDFIYFSFVTVTTVGYGDIVPAHTFVRGLVLFQVLFGLSLILRLSLTPSDSENQET